MSSSSFIPVAAPFRAYHLSHHSEPSILEARPVRSTRPSCTKFLERQVIQAWKRVTEATRKPQRAHLLPKDFVLVTSRRRSVMYR